jgi:hypothetical protein
MNSLKASLDGNRKQGQNLSDKGMGLRSGSKAMAGSSPSVGKIQPVHASSLLERPVRKRLQGTKRRTSELSPCALLALCCASCEPTLVVGEWSCTTQAQDEAMSALEFPTPDEPVEPNWQTGFENGFCDYFESTGFCYANANASYELVDFPVHSGKWAASYTISGQDADGLQARCVRHGELPREAYYGAWLYVPANVTQTDNWNLFHFEGREKDDPTPDEQHGLWDVSLRVAANGELRAYVFDFLGGMTFNLSGAAAIPAEEWFHLEVFLRRASDPSGRFELYIDGDLSLTLTDVVTDDTELGQWYAGNFAKDITPSPNTLFVDDVTISRTRQSDN